MKTRNRGYTVSLWDNDGRCVGSLRGSSKTLAGAKDIAVTYNGNFNIRIERVVEYWNEEEDEWNVDVERSYAFTKYTNG